MNITIIMIIFIPFIFIVFRDWGNENNDNARFAIKQEEFVFKNINNFLLQNNLHWVRTHKSYRNYLFNKNENTFVKESKYCPSTEELKLYLEKLELNESDKLKCIEYYNYIFFNNRDGLKNNNYVSLLSFNFGSFRIAQYFFTQKEKFKLVEHWDKTNHIYYLMTEE